ncbi:MAG: hypothetical protein WCJ97_09290 [Phycisphaerae bacterium]
MKEFVRKYRYGITMAALLLGAVAAVVLAIIYLTRYLGLSSNEGCTLALSGFSAFLASVYASYTHKIEKVKLFHELFKYYNCRYDSYNGILNSIVKDEDKDEDKGVELKYSDGSADGDKLAASRIKVVDDYFNLCAEEFFYYKQNVIPEDVWKSWRAGMQYFYNKDKRIQDMWDLAFKENEKSYYGFTIKDLLRDNTPTKSRA